MIKKQDVGMHLVPDSAEVWNKIIYSFFEAKQLETI